MVRSTLFLVVVWATILLFPSCHGIEADVSKKLDFDFTLIGTGFANEFRQVAISEHNEIDDYIEYAVYPDRYRMNGVSYEISSVEVNNIASEVDLNVFYRNSVLDTISLFQVNNLPLEISERVDISVSQSDLNALTTLLNTNIGRFDIYIEAVSDEENISFVLTLYFDTTVAIDYDL